MLRPRTDAEFSDVEIEVRERRIKRYLIFTSFKIIKLTFYNNLVMIQIMAKALYYLFSAMDLYKRMTALHDV